MRRVQVQGYMEIIIIDWAKEHVLTDKLMIREIETAKVAVVVEAMMMRVNDSLRNIQKVIKQRKYAMISAQLEVIMLINRERWIKVCNAREKITHIIGHLGGLVQMTTPTRQAE
jgi:hypothetical protein